LSIRGGGVQRNGFASTVAARDYGIGKVIDDVAKV
jgi:hypothetical protein